MARQPTPRKFYQTERGVYPAGSPNPTLQALIGQCASASTGVEVQLSLCMGSLLGIENAASVAVFVSLKNARSRRDALMAAALHTLNDSELEIFRALIRIYERLDSFRNDVVHGMWGYIKGIEDACLWCSSASYAVWHITDYHKSESGSLSYEWRNEQFNKLLYWSHSDIKNSIDEILVLEKCLGHFHAYLRYKGDQSGDWSYKQLLGEPLVQRALEELQSQAGK